MKFGEFELSIIRECKFGLDGGAMFGVVPKSLWQRVSPADEDNRVHLNCNLLLVETPSHRVLVETGMGDRWSRKERERYAVETLVETGNMLSSLNLSNDDIDAVIISHLHFDHAGGATRLVNGALEPTFKNAKYYIQKGEWDFAHNCNARAVASYRMDDIEPLQKHGVLELIEGDTEVVPGVWARVTGGHTKHHQIVCFESGDSKGVFFADIMPTKCHVQPPWVMGYDHYPLTSCDIKSEWLKRAADENWLVVFDHEPGVPWGHVVLNEKGRFDFEPLLENTLAFRSPV
ncbi:MAG: MBL fold metallo-hydrolase [Candidatus Obscuribacterales bacterium]|nr:MBL fold metallo-hydrolase [Candidatus Obscuribacterales bacterium]